MSYAILDTKEYADIIRSTTGVKIDPSSNDVGVFAFDNKSGLVFEFDCVAYAMEVNNGHFIIFDGKSIYLKNKTITLKEKMYLPEFIKMCRTIDMISIAE